MRKNIAHIANSTIKRADNVREILHKDGDTNDIINTILYADKMAGSFTKEFAQHLQGPTLIATCGNIWKFIKENIRYKEDGGTFQDIQSPAHLWSSKQGDCKSFSVFAASCLRNLNIPYNYRFVSFNPYSTRVTHVYVIVPTKSGEIIIDAVWHSFNQQKKFQSKKDIPMTKISYVRGVGSSVQYKPGMLKLPTDLEKVTDLEMDLMLAKQNAEIKKMNLQKVAGIGTLKEEGYNGKILAIDHLLEAVRANNRVGDAETIGMIADDIANGKYHFADHLDGIGDVNDRKLVRKRLAHEMVMDRKSRHSRNFLLQARKIERNAAGELNPEIRGKMLMDASKLRDKATLVEDEHINGGPGVGSFFGNIFKGIAKGVKNIVKETGKVAKKAGQAVLNVVTFPLKLAAKGILEIMLPKSAPFFLYLFINDPALIAKMPQGARNKRKKAEGVANFITKTIGMRPAHFMGIIRNANEKRFGMPPEKYLAQVMKGKISGIGVLPLALIGPVIEIIKKIASVFGKKHDDNVTEADAPAPESDFGTAAQAATFADSVASQPIPPFVDGEGQLDAMTAADPAQISTSWC